MPPATLIACQAQDQAEWSVSELVVAAASEAGLPEEKIANAMRATGSLMTAHLFVYGTLRADSRHAVNRMLSGNATLVGKATVGGLLYDLGAFPGAIPSAEAAERVKGELYALDRHGLLPLLDAYEGCGSGDPEPHLFRKEAVGVRLDGGGEVRAWIYWYAGDLGGAEAISSGDYLARS